MKQATLYYAHDPMCSWCYGFRPVWQQLREWCEGKITIEYLLGGLAKDSDEVMSEQMQQDIQGYWRNIQKVIPGTEFNFDFWKVNHPRRSTYRSCRAVIATRLQDPSKELDMIRNIQNAYYLQAKNPSDADVLIECAQALDLNVNAFSETLDHESTQQLLRYEMLQCHELGLHSFPSLLLNVNDEHHDIVIDYNHAESMKNRIQECLK